MWPTSARSSPSRRSARNEPPTLIEPRTRTLKVERSPHTSFIPPSHLPVIVEGEQGRPTEGRRHRDHMKENTMFRKLVAIGALSGTMALGAVGIASASTPTTPATPSTHTVDCTKALARVPKINALEAKAATWGTKAQPREATATPAGHTKLATRIGNRITRVQKLEAKGTTLLARISAACGTASSAS